MSALKKLFDNMYASALRLNNPYYFLGIARRDYVRAGGKVALKKLNIEVDPVKFEALLRGYPFAVKIFDSLGGRFTVEQDRLLLHLNDLCFQINSAEELFIVYEVFVSGVYRYTGARDAVFVDIGMNSATTTLFYARQDFIKKVFGFELFAPTYALAKTNLELNTRYAGKVEAVCYGLSDSEFEKDLSYSLSRKGRMGLNGLPSDEQFVDVSSEHVKVKDVATVFKKIADESNGLDIIVKIDCEGEEYKIIDRLAATQLLERLSVLMIEWHFSNPSTIETHLRQAGFSVFTQTLPSQDSGMIYAARQLR